ncbi:MAG TPA: hypothetical protein VK969_09535 [Acidimicrobiia bacterium]|nr:hypothetical protein [Acidimicrobiia bacterium]
MSTDTQSTIAIPPATRDRSSRSWFWPGIAVAAIGLIVGLVIGVTSFQDSQQQVDAFARSSVPGTVTVEVDEPGQQVVYYEGDLRVGFEDLVVDVSDATGATVAIAPYGSELIYESTDQTLGRAIATFDAARVGAYEIEVSGIDTGQVTVGKSFARLALPGILAGLVIAGLSLVAGLALWLVSALRR